MVLNYIWFGFIFIAFIVAICKFLFLGDTEVFTEIVLSTFDSAKLGFNVSIGLTGILALWLGIMRIGEKSGLIKIFARVASPLFIKLFPGIPKDHPATSAMFLNFSANLLGLDNAATPIGLKAMQHLQSLNDKKDTATNAMIMFLCINASGLTIIPITIMMYRAQMGASNPSDVFLPIILATSIATFVAILSVCVIQKINIFQKQIMLFFLSVLIFIGLIAACFHYYPQEQVTLYASFIGNMVLFTVIVAIILSGVIKRINVYNTFIEGAKEGFHTAVLIIPYLVAILVAIGVFRASGAMDYFIESIRFMVSLIHLDTSFIEGLPTLIMKPLSGSGSRGLMLDAMQTYGADSFVARVASVGQGSTDTVFYVIAVYYGAVGIKNTRHTIPCALLADVAGAIAAILFSYLFFSTV